MKKFIIALAALSMTATPAFAEHRRGYEYREHRSGTKCGWLCGAIIGGVVVSAITKEQRRNERVYEREVIVRDTYYPPVRPQTQVCYDVIAYDYYNNPYVVRRDCRYQ